MTKKEYLMSKDEIIQLDMIENIFKKFDTNKSGSLDINEL